jgi:hypothetical protein
MSNAFEYGDALLPQSEPTSAEAEKEKEKEQEGEGEGEKEKEKEKREVEEGEGPERPRIESNQPYLNLAT